MDTAPRGPLTAPPALCGHEPPAGGPGTTPRGLERKTGAMPMAVRIGMSSVRDGPAPRRPLVAAAEPVGCVTCRATDVRSLTNPDRDT